MLLSKATYVAFKLQLYRKLCIHIYIVLERVKIIRDGG